jgi:hypothetical protein
VEHVLCCAHTLNLVVQHSIENSLIKPLLDKVTSVVCHFRHSTKDTDLLVLTQKMTLTNKNNETKQNITQKHSTVLKLIQDCATRWNSTYFMVKRFLKLKNSITWLQMTGKISILESVSFSSDEWKQMEMLCDLLSPFQQVTESLCAEQYPTLSIVYPLICSLQSHLNNNKWKENIVINSIQQMLHQNLGKYWLKPSKCNKAAIWQVETFLDPRFKTMSLLNEEERQQIQQAVRQMMKTETIPRCHEIPGIMV